MRTIAFALALLIAVPAFAEEAALPLDRLDPSQIEMHARILQALEPVIERRKQAGIAPLTTFEELYEPLTDRQRDFLDAFRRISPADVGGASRRLPPPAPDEGFIRLHPQSIARGGEPVRLDSQYLPGPVFDAYSRMMAAMEAELGKRLLVESGYRSPAYQLYLFLFYMPKHGYSIRETNRFVALPGCSEHGSPSYQAIDFITPEGINGEDRPEEFEELQEYGWLSARGPEFGFHLSYPRGGESAFEPWHWHYEER